MEFDNPIIINERNRQKIEKALNEVQKRCTTRTIDYFDIVHELKAVSNQLCFVCTKKGLENTSVSIDVNGQNFPNAYKYSAESTQFCAIYLKGNWRLVYLGRDYCRSYAQRWNIFLSEAAKQCILETFSKDINR